MLSWMIFLFIIFFLFWIMRTVTDLSIFHKEHASRQLCMEHYTNLLAILEQAKNTAFQKIWQEQILVHISSGYKTEQKELDVLGRDYVNLVLSFCGPSVQKDFQTIHGDLDSICLFLLTGFVNRIIEDESRVLSLATDENSGPEDMNKVIKPPSLSER